MSWKCDEPPLSVSSALCHRCMRPLSGEIMIFTNGRQECIEHYFDPYSARNKPTTKELLALSPEGRNRCK